MRWILLVALVLASVAGCGGEARETSVIVSAASSLTDVLAEIEEAFEAAHPGVDVVVNTAASSTLREQILAGAPVDVFAPASASHMEEIIEAGLAVDPKSFASNRLQIAVPSGNPGGVEQIADFARDELLLGLCVEAAPCGDLARQALELAGVEPSLDTEEPNVRALLTKIAGGELDAGIVYATDVASAGTAVEGIDLGFDAPGAEYLITTLRTGRSSAAEFVAFVLSADGRAILDEYGFGSP